MSLWRPFSNPIRDALPIILAYFPIAVTFGVVARTSGIPWLITVLISLLIYAGGAQFMLVSLVLAKTAPIPVIITVLLVNSRHFLYGTTLGPAFSTWAEGKKWISAFGLTDEVFAVTSSRVLIQPPTPLYQITFTFSCYASWVLGTLVGASIGSVVPPSVANILSFALPALFLALFLLGKRSFEHLLAGTIGATVAVLATQLHWGSLGIILGALLGATVGMGLHAFRSSLKPTKSMLR